VRIVFDGDSSRKAIASLSIRTKAEI
jgi:hypothetical protein